MSKNRKQTLVRINSSDKEVLRKLSALTGESIPKLLRKGLMLIAPEHYDPLLVEFTTQSTGEQE